ncbi:aminoacyl-tRNA hydrolase [Williamsia sp. CHRR-6]|uniref:aminoacyl-tRNA hydrolase n=1 Tax=Williamsia sp. CHRR-6 TaxID=2835871 RepID=UPI001BDB5339|nr:aminoacyl-tRNA hydrolase [Williamsia sp. CHRR-6]MBT0565485.1 peptidyl-tRNA hydrolase [Williamsia sp. CHRR-6]
MVFADRHRMLADYVGGGTDPEDPTRILAMPIVLRIEKATPPPRRGLLEAAARAAVLLCLDERVDVDPDSAVPGPWHEPVHSWMDARIRKISRRARGAGWVAAQEVWGVTVDTGAAAARAIVPCPVGEVDRRIAKLQISGTEVDGDLSGASAGDAEDLTLWVNPGLSMTVGKLAAQVGHAAMLAVGLYDPDEAYRWWVAGAPLQVTMAEPDHWRRLSAADPATVAVVRDAGYTEVAPGSTTVIARRRDLTDLDRLSR